MAVVLLDVDQVTLDLPVKWYGRYNADYDDNLTAERVTKWAVDEFVKPECGKKIYDYLLLLDLYDDMPPVEGAVEGIAALHAAKHRVVFVSSGIHRGKYLRLKELGLVDTESNYICAHDKSLVMGDYLVDDGFHNITAFQNNGMSILFDAPHNRHETWRNRAKNWTQVITLIRYYEEEKIRDRDRWAAITSAL